jgi:hypothetical protein
VPLTRWPEDGPSLTATTRGGTRRVRVGAEGWCRSNQRMGREAGLDRVDWREKLDTDTVQRTLEAVDGSHCPRPIGTLSAIDRNHCPLSPGSATRTFAAFQHSPFRA